jgi:hypothetical protein
MIESGANQPMHLTAAAFQFFRVQSLTSRRGSRPRTTGRSSDDDHALMPVLKE